MTEAHLRLAGAPAERPTPDFPVVDYDGHPAYRGFPAAPASASNAALELLGEIDATLRIASGGYPGASRRKIDALFRADLDERLAELIAITARCIGAAALERDALRRTAAVLRPTLLENARYASQRRRYPANAPRDAPSRQIAHRLNEAGVYACHLDAWRIQGIQRLAEPLQEQAERRARQSPEQRCQVPVPTEGPLWDAVAALVRDTGLQAGLSQYDRHRLRVAWATLEHSTPAQRWGADPYTEGGRAAGRCASFHNDPTHRTLKTIVYLSEVGSGGGAFGYVGGSHRWRRSPAATAFVKAMDQGRDAAWRERHPQPEPSRRPYLREAATREGFMRLPTPLRATRQLGDDVRDGTALCARLLAGEQVFRSEDANCIAFDGDRGIHRGGTVREGTRWALHIGYEAVRFEPRRTQTRARRWIRRTLRGKR